MEECTAVSRVVVGVVVSVVDGHVVKEVGIRKGKADMNAERSMMGLRAQSRREGGGGTCNPRTVSVVVFSNALEPHDALKRICNAVPVLQRWREILQILDTTHTTGTCYYGCTQMPSALCPTRNGQEMTPTRIDHSLFSLF